MKISEAAIAAGLDVSSVRFYERKGLINPDRGEDSNYRDYTSEDIDRLKKIVLFRKIDMSIEDIKKVLLDNQDITEVLESQMEKLQQDKLQIDSSIQLCQKMMDEGYTDSDTERYISYVYEAESQGQKFPDIMPVLDQISQNSGMEKVIGYPIFLKLMANTLSRRLLSVGIFLVMVIFPLTELVISIFKFLSGNGRLIVIVLWFVYSFLLISIFGKMLGITSKA
ncbi:MAG: MerR family transcriptional regulator [Butyrivibrio sp.]|nr:MerR family transcriptional regulator [Butyrivibrio sp.]